MGNYDWNSLKSGLQKGVGEKSGSKDYNDPREWKLARDADENGTAVIRLLPGKGGNTPPIVRVYEHSARVFHKGENKYRYYIEPSPSSIGEACPISEVWYELGDVGTEEAEKIKKTFSRSTKFIANILVVNDPANPENNGKVFYWKFGVKLFEKFQAALEPTEAQIKVGKRPIELFDPMLGADVMLQTKKLAGFVNYDDTTIEMPSAAFESEDVMTEVVTEKCIDLTEFISADHYKAYKDLQGKLAWILEKTPIEAMLIANGSAVITQPYVSKARAQASGGAQGGAQGDSATPNIGGGYNAPESAPAKQATPAPTPEPTPTPEPEKAPEKAPEKEPEKLDVTGATDDAILDMLDGL